MYRPRGRSSAFTSKVDEQEAKEVQNARAIQVLARVKEKLTGTDFPAKEKDRQLSVAGTGAPIEELKVDLQVDRLIREATNLENLCQHYIGWCSFW
jgi:FKBP12-rapamycin complex-associated protein